MHERLTEDQRILDAGDELDPGIRQTPAISVYRGQGRSFRILHYVFFKPNLPEMGGETIVWCLHSSFAQ